MKKSANNKSRKLYFSKESALILIVICFLLIIFEVIFSIHMHRHLGSIYWNMHRSELKKITDVAYSSFKPLLSRLDKKEITKEAALKSIIETVNGMIYFDGIQTNYFLLLSKDGTLLAHPFDKEAIGSNRGSDSNINNLSKDIRNIIDSPEGGGFLSYDMYYYPERKNLGKKLTYMRFFPELGCLIGTGFYVNEHIKESEKIQHTMEFVSFSMLFLIVITVIISLIKINNAMRKLSFSENRFKSIFNGIDHFVALLDSDFNILEINETARRMTGHEVKDLEGLSFVSSPFWSDAIGSRDIVNKAISEMREGKINRYNAEICTKSGEKVFVEFSIYPEKHNLSGARQYIAEAKDQTEKIKYQEEVYWLAYYDHITKLPNELLFETTVSGFLKNYDPRGAIIAVIKIMDIAFINSLISVDAGTKLLQAFSKRLTDNIPTGAVAGRLHGGYFIIYIPPESINDNALSKEEYLKSICMKNPEPLYFSGHAVHVSIKIGASVYPYHGSNYNELLQNALIAQNTARTYASKCVELFDASLLEATRRQKIIESILNSNAITDSVYVNFQPIFDCENQELAGFEALARFSHPDTGDVTPLEFIPIAERTGTIDRVFSIVLEKAAFLASEGRKDSLHVSVNISTLQLLDNHFQKQLLNSLKKYDLPNHAIPIEITESVLIDSFSTITGFLDDLSSKGILIFIDDFGTGFSSLSYLRNLPANVLKIDKSFVNDIHTNTVSRGIIEPLLIMARNIGMKVIAEGVENAEQAEILKGINCDYLQGWYLGKPMSEKDALKLIGKNSS